jgi:hypothetical protein
MVFNPISFIGYIIFYGPILISINYTIFFTSAIVFPPAIPLHVLYLLYITFFLPSQMEIDFYYKYLSWIIRAITSSTNVHRFIKVDDAITTDAINNYKKTPTIYLINPHGLFTQSRMIHAQHNLAPLYSLFQNTKMVFHNNLFRMPIAREIFLMAGAIPSSPEYIAHVLKSGYSVTHSIAGMREIIYANEKYKDDHLFIKNRIGHIKLSRSLNVPIVPIYFWNEQQSFTGNGTLERPFMYLLKLITGRYTYFTLGDFKTLKRVFYDMYTKPDNVAVKNKEVISTTYIGEPFKVLDGESNEVAHSRYLDEVRKLFERAKKKENSDRNLIIE